MSLEFVETEEKEKALESLPEGWMLVQDYMYESSYPDVVRNFIDDVGNNIYSYDDCFDDAINEFADSYVDVYSYKLYKWLAEENGAQYVAEAIDEGLYVIDSKTFSLDSLLMVGQYLDYRETLGSYREEILQRLAVAYYAYENDAVAVSPDVIEFVEDNIGLGTFDDGLCDDLCDFIEDINPQNDESLNSQFMTKEQLQERMKDAPSKSTPSLRETAAECREAAEAKASESEHTNNRTQESR